MNNGLSFDVPADAVGVMVVTVRQIASQHDCTFEMTPRFIQRIAPSHVLTFRFLGDKADAAEAELRRRYSAGSPDSP